MKKGLILLIIMFCSAVTLLSCRSTRTTVVERTQHDTIYRERMAMDSIRIDHALYVDHTKDTIILRDSIRTIHYRTRHDSVYIIRTDTVPKVMEVERVKEVARQRTWFDWTGYICIFIVLNYFGIRVSKWKMHL